MGSALPLGHQNSVCHLLEHVLGHMIEHIPMLVPQNRRPELPSFPLLNLLLLHRD